MLNRLPLICIKRGTQERARQSAEVRMHRGIEQSYTSESAFLLVCGGFTNLC